MHGIFIYNYILLFIIVFDLSLKISGTIGLAGRQSSPFTPGERILKAQREARSPRCPIRVKQERQEVDCRFWE